MSTVTVRRVPRLGGFSPAVIGLELRRAVRNRRTVILTLVLPAVFFLLFGGPGRGGGDGVSGFVLISMAVYGAMLATASGGATVSIERAAGWSRQLRLTPLHPAAYIAVKLALAMTVGGVSVAVTLLVGALSGARFGASVWVGCGLLAWVCALVFAAFGVLMGYLLPGENVMQILGTVLGTLSFAGGLFVPVEQFGHTFAAIAAFTPVYGVAQIARYPLTHDGNLWVAAFNVTVWTALFAAGAVYRMRRDTARV